MTTKPPQPLYDPLTAAAGFDLRYTWTGWPSRGHFASVRQALLDEVRLNWERDGLRLLEHLWTPESVKLTFSTPPSVSPVLLASRAKGRLDHAMRTAGTAISFSRKVAVRAVGENSRRDVEQYIAEQVTKERFADPRFERRMREFTIHDPDVDLSRPAESARGRYWHNLHVVLVMAGRVVVTDYQVLARLRDRSLAIAERKGYSISWLSVMPDHLHVALRGVIDQSPAEIAGAFQNNLAYVLGQKRIWNDGYYVGTFGEYNMEAIRRSIRRTSGECDT
jgi:REP element-mobilizing transposase RayT